MSIVALQTSGGDLVRYEAMCRAIEDSYQFDELIDIRDRTAAMEAAARVAKNEEAEARCREIRCRAMARMGELLKEHKETVGFNVGASLPRNGAAPGGTVDERPTLAEIGLSRQQASDCRRMADIPRGEFDAAFANGAKPSIKKLTREMHNEDGVGTDLATLVSKVRKDVHAHQLVLDNVGITRIASGKSLLALKRAYEQQGYTDEEWWAWFEGRFSVTRHRAEQRINEAEGR